MMLARTVSGIALREQVVNRGGVASVRGDVAQRIAATDAGPLPWGGRTPAPRHQHRTHQKYSHTLDSTRFDRSAAPNRVRIGYVVSASKGGLWA